MTLGKWILGPNALFAILWNTDVTWPQESWWEIYLISWITFILQDWELSHCNYQNFWLSSLPYLLRPASYMHPLIHLPSRGQARRTRCRPTKDKNWTIRVHCSPPKPRDEDQNWLKALRKFDKNLKNNWKDDLATIHQYSASCATLLECSKLWRSYWAVSFDLSTR